MNPTDLTPQPVAPVLEVHQKDETKKVSFWVSQLFILLATVVGVYLASSQGFRQALAYGEIQADKGNYFLRKSLKGEIEDNIVLVREYMQRLDTGGIQARQASFRLDTFVWENMKFSSSTLETPPELLRESRQFYRGVADIQEKIANNTYGVKKGTELLTDLLKRMEDEVLPKFGTDLAALQKGLRDRGVEVK